MNFELKKLKISKAQSEETIAFTASLYVDGKKIGHVSNSGRGEAHRLMPEPGKREQLTAFENWCNSQPHASFPGTMEKFRSNADLQISIAVQKAAILKNLKKTFDYKIVCGKPDLSEDLYSYGMTVMFSKVDQHKDAEGLRAALKTRIQTIKAGLPEGHVILNDNIAEYL